MYLCTLIIYWKEMNDLLDKLAVIHQKWLEIGEEITKPEVIADMKRFIKLSKDYKDLQAVVDAYKKYKNIVENIANTKEVIATEKDDISSILFFLKLC